jgi:hypothetical protein
MISRSPRPIRAAGPHPGPGKVTGPSAGAAAGSRQPAAASGLLDS